MNTKLEFPCPYRDYKQVNTAVCSDCRNRNTCDIYSTMLNEERDIKKDEGH